MFGVGGMLFLLMLANSALALALTYGLRLAGAAVDVWRDAAHRRAGGGLWLVAPAASSTQGPPMSFGIASVDDYIDAPSSAQSRDVWTQYEAQVQELAGSGAASCCCRRRSTCWRRPMPKLRKAMAGAAWRARIRSGWWPGSASMTAQQRRNEAWWFAPDGRLVTNYLKHFMAPPEREFVAGDEFPVNDIAGVRYGVAICKDMHFASLGRGFGQRHARVMLVPAWDFDARRRMAANMTKMRGIENGYQSWCARRATACCRSRTPSAACWRWSAARNCPAPRCSPRCRCRERIDTLYTRTGDLLGWMCVIAAVLTCCLPPQWGHSSFPSNGDRPDQSGRRCKRGRPRLLGNEECPH